MLGKAKMCLREVSRVNAFWPQQSFVRNATLQYDYHSFLKKSKRRHLKGSTIIDYNPVNFSRVPL